MIRNKVIVIVFIVFGIGLISCKHPHENSVASKQSQKPKKELNLHIQRMEKDIFTLNIDLIAEGIPGLRAKYGEFFNLYNYKVIGLGSSTDPKYPNLLKRFITDYYINLDYQRVMKIYPDVNGLEKEFSHVFEKYQEFFPEKRIPRIYTYVSGWNQSIVTADTLLGVALDKYLGRNCDFYEKLGIDKYKRYTMQREYIIPDALRTWGYTQFEFSDSSSKVLDNMLYEGKILFFMKQLIPDAEDSIVFGYSPAQLKWCHNNIGAMWTYLAEHKLLFSTDYLTIRKLVYPAPFTYYFTNESPGRAAVWLGYKIIESYWKNNPDITLPKLMALNNYQKILRDSKFKP
jgi:hypothetical protein